MLLVDKSDAFLPDGRDLGRLPVAVRGGGALLHPPVVMGGSIVPLPVLLRSRFVPLPRVAGDELAVVVDGQTPHLVLAGSRHVLSSVPTVDGCIPDSALKLLACNNPYPTV